MSQLAVLDRPVAAERAGRPEERPMPVEFYVWKNEGGAFLPED